MVMRAASHSAASGVADGWAFTAKAGGGGGAAGDGPVGGTGCVSSIGCPRLALARRSHACSLGRTFATLARCFWKSRSRFRSLRASWAAVFCRGTACARAGAGLARQPAGCWLACGDPALTNCEASALMRSLRSHSCCALRSGFRLSVSPSSSATSPSSPTTPRRRGAAATTWFRAVIGVAVRYYARTRGLQRHSLRGSGCGRGVPPTFPPYTSPKYPRRVQSSLSWMYARAAGLDVPPTICCLRMVSVCTRLLIEISGGATRRHRCAVWLTELEL